MKKILITMALCVFALAGYAQKGEMTASAQFMLGAGQGITNPGLGAKFSYSITDPWRLAASFDYGFRNKGIASWDINVDAHYQFFFGKGMRAYPLAGFTVMGYQSKISVADYGDYDGGYDYGIGDSSIPVVTKSSPETRASSTTYRSNTVCVGMNIGGGFQYDINDAWAVYTEMKGQLVSKHGSRFVWTIGGSYKF